MKTLESVRRDRNGRGGYDTVVILPTYNEAENLKILLPKLLKQAVDVLVVDDSPDERTASVARGQGCQVLKRSYRGRATAITDGIAATHHKYIITMDADLQHPPETIPLILEALPRADVVVASRYVLGGGDGRSGFRSKVISRIARWLAWPLAPRLKDRSSGFLAFRRDVIEGVKLPSGFSTLTLGIAVAGNYTTLVEVPFMFLYRRNGHSKLSNGVIIEHLKQLVKLYLHKFQILRFALVGGSGAVLGLSILALMVEVMGVYYLAAYPVSFIASTTNNYVWNSRWTFKRRRGLLGWIKYVVMCGCTLALNTALMYVLTDLLHVWYLLSAAMVVLAVFLLNYFLSGRLVWRG